MFLHHKVLLETYFLYIVQAQNLMHHCWLAVCMLLLRQLLKQNHFVPSSEQPAFGRLKSRLIHSNWPNLMWEEEFPSSPAKSKSPFRGELSRLWHTGLPEERKVHPTSGHCSDKWIKWSKLIVGDDDTCFTSNPFLFGLHVQIVIMHKVGCENRFKSQLSISGNEQKTSKLPCPFMYGGELHSRHTFISINFALLALFQ